MNVLARFATGLLFALSLTQCATQREVDLGREFTRDSRKGRSVIDSANQSFDLVLSLAYPQQDPCVEMVRNIMNQMRLPTTVTSTHELPRQLEFPRVNHSAQISLIVTQPWRSTSNGAML
jgi:hypothetical protein